MTPLMWNSLYHQEIHCVALVSGGRALAQPPLSSARCSIILSIGVTRIKGTPGIEWASGVCNPARSRNPRARMHIIPWGGCYPRATITRARSHRTASDTCGASHTGARPYTTTANACGASSLSFSIGYPKTDREQSTDHHQRYESNECFRQRLLKLHNLHG